MKKCQSPFINGYFFHFFRHVRRLKPCHWANPVTLDCWRLQAKIHKVHCSHRWSSLVFRLLVFKLCQSVPSAFLQSCHYDRWQIYLKIKAVWIITGMYFNYFRDWSGSDARHIYFNGCSIFQAEERICWDICRCCLRPGDKPHVYFYCERNKVNMAKFLAKKLAIF